MHLGILKFWKYPISFAFSIFSGEKKKVLEQKLDCNKLKMNCENLLFMIIFLFKKPHNRTYVKKHNWWHWCHMITNQTLFQITVVHRDVPLNRVIQRAEHWLMKLLSCDAPFGRTLNLHHTPAYPAFINPQHAVLKVNPQKKKVNHISKSTKWRSRLKKMTPILSTIKMFCTVTIFHDNPCSSPHYKYDFKSAGSIWYTLNKFWELIL